jgi:hypothetical protein
VPPTLWNHDKAPMVAKTLILGCCFVASGLGSYLNTRRVTWAMKVNGYVDADRGYPPTTAVMNLRSALDLGVVISAEIEIPP